MEMEKIYSLEDYQNEFGIPIWVIVDALKNGIVDSNRRKHSGLRLEFRDGQWWLDNVTDCFLLNTFGVTWTFYEKKKKKTYAEVKCDVMDCEKCPISSLDYGTRYENTLQEILGSLELDDEEREFYQKRIDREYKGE